MSDFFVHPFPEQVLVAFQGQPVLVVGDLILDRYLWGEVSRISPEAPVPVVRLLRESETCGGAANVALNLAGLGVHPTVAGFVGQDQAGERLLALLADQGVVTGPIVPVAGRPTITKTRIIGGHQQMLRLDQEETGSPTPTAVMELTRAVIAELVAHPPAAVLLSDYAKGALEPLLCHDVIQTARAMGVPVLVDPKGKDYQKYRGATAITPNRQELAQVTGLPVGELESLLAAGARLRHDLQLDFLAVTLSEMGIVLLDDAGLRRIPAMAKEVFDVSGAGDTVIATLAAALATGMERLAAIHLANLAAGVVVGKVGTSPIHRSELLAALSAEDALEQSAKVCSREEAMVRVEAWRQRGERVVFTNGCFDLLHAGHVTYLEQARRLGSRLVVGLNTDRSVREIKGPTRPVIHQEDRARVLAALAAVDLVVLFDEENPLELIERLRPDILAKGADYQEEQVVGGTLIKSWGGRVALVPLVEGRSSSRIVARINGAQGN